MLYILLGIVALLALFVSVPVVLRVTYDGSDVHFGLRYLFISYTIYPREEKEKSRLRKYIDDVFSELKRKNTERKKKKKPAKPESEKPKESTWKRLRRERGFWGAVGYILSVVRQSANLGAYIVRRSVISRMKIHVAVGGDDAAGIAMEQGKWCAALYPALSLLMCSVKGYRNCSVNIGADFLSSENRYDIDFRLRVKPFHGIVGAVRMFGSLLRAEVENKQADMTLEALERASHTGEDN